MDDTRQCGRLDAGLLDRVDAQAKSFGLSRRDLVERYLRMGLEGKPPTVYRVVVPTGFEGSVSSGHADVPGLRWYRPSSAEGKQGVEVDTRLVRAAKEKLK